MTLGYPLTQLPAASWRHLRAADWPLLPLALTVLLVLARVIGARYYLYWSDWLAWFTGFLAAYAAVASLRIALQSLCFDHAPACWIAFCIAAFGGWLAAWVLFVMLMPIGVPAGYGSAWGVYAMMVAAALVLPEEVASERRRWAGKAAVAAAQREREQLRERQLLEARMAALQGQIEPHFLHNTLANARALIRQDAAAAETMLQHLSRFLRSAMPDLRASTTSLGQELDRGQAYLDIIKLRMGDRLRFQIVASEAARACPVPPLSVMTLIENAIQHGLEPKVEGGTLQVEARCADGRLQVEVRDDGVGFQSETGEGVGLVNLQQRLAALFGDAAELLIEPGAGGGLLARISMPGQHGAAP